jgi:flagellar basal body-associated protein FliL
MNPVQTKSKSKIILAVLAVIVVVMIVGGAVYAFFLAGKTDTANTNGDANNNQQIDSEPASKKQVTNESVQKDLGLLDAALKDASQDHEKAKATLQDEKRVKVSN